MSNKDYNKRMKTKELEVKSKKKETFVVKKIDLQEILDESGEVNETTIIKLNCDGILIHMSIGAAYRLFRDLRTILEL
jgi:hypothetical protein